MIDSCKAKPSAGKLFVEFFFLAVTEERVHEHGLLYPPCWCCISEQLSATFA